MPEAAAETKATYPNPNNPTQSLAQSVQENTDKEYLEIIISHDMDLAIEAGLHFTAANEIVLKAKNALRRPTIRFTYEGAAASNLPWSAITFDAKKCEVQNVRVVLDGRQSETQMIGMHFMRGMNTVKGCEFIQAQPGQTDKSRLSSVVVEATRPDANLELVECCFLAYRDLRYNENKAPTGIDTVELARLDSSRHDAIVRRGPASITAVNCAFSPHAAAFRLEKRSANPPRVHLEHCTLALDNQSVAIQLDGNASAEIDANHSLFAGTGEPGDAGSVLIRQTDLSIPERGVRFAGLDNRYFNLAAYWPGAQRSCRHVGGVQGQVRAIVHHGRVG